MTKAQAKKKVTRRQKVARLSAEGDAQRRPRYLPEEMASLYRPLKKLVSLRVDADVLAWFQQQGPGYQTRINQTLRKAMLENRKKARE
jgi:uncharacterized protein (DUF4415 family)